MRHVALRRSLCAHAALCMPKPPSARFRAGYFEARRQAGRASLIIGSCLAARIAGLRTETVRYWCKKVQNPQYRDKPWGGPRRARFSVPDRAALHLALFRLCKARPLSRLMEFRQALVAQNPLWRLSNSQLSVIFRRWKWSFKKPHRYQYLKYTRENINYYITYIHAVAGIPWVRMKFLDEGHFASRGTPAVTSLFIKLSF